MDLHTEFSIIIVVRRDVFEAWLRDRAARFGHAPDIRPVGQGEIFMRLTQASTNYVALGEPAFAALTRFVRDVPARAIDFPTGADAIAMVESLWKEWV